MEDETPLFEPGEVHHLVIVGWFALAVVPAGGLAVNHNIRMKESGGKEAPCYGPVLCGGPLVGVDGCAAVLSYLGGGACFSPI